MLTHQKATGDEAWEGSEGGGGVLLQLQHGEIGQCIHCSEKLLSGLSILVIMWGGDLVMGLLGVFVFPTCPRAWKVSGRPSATLVGSLFRGGCVRDAML